MNVRKSDRVTWLTSITYMQQLLVTMSLLVMNCEIAEACCNICPYNTLQDSNPAENVAS